MSAIRGRSLVELTKIWVGLYIPIPENSVKSAFLVAFEGDTPNFYSTPQTGSKLPELIQYITCDLFFVLFLLSMNTARILQSGVFIDTMF